MVQQCFEALGSKQAEAILGFHVLTGCDQIGRFSGKSKSSWWQEFLKCNEDALIALAKLGDEEVLPSFSTLDNIERLVVAVYGEKKKSENIERLVRLCWYFFSKFQSDAPQLPSMMSALKYKIFWSHFVCIVLKHAHLPIQNLPSPEGYGWELNGNSLGPIMTDDLPAPIGLIELSVRNCKSGRASKWCRCLKNNLVCTDMCKCQNCENADDFDIDDDNINSDIDDEGSDLEE